MIPSRTLAGACGLALAVVSGGCVSGSDIDAINQRLTDIRRDIQVLQAESSSKGEVAELQQTVSDQIRASLKSEADMQVGLQALSRQIDQLQANLEDTNYRLAQLSQQIASTNQELQAFRTSNLSPVSSTSPTPQARVSEPSDPQAMYQTAYSDYLRGNYDMAILGFRQYLETFPNTELADNATYWIGESYFSQGKHDQAIREFDHILTAYPRSDKTASAMLKKGYSFLESGQRDEGVRHLRIVIRDYNGTDEANLARQRLGALGVDAR